MPAMVAPMVNAPLVQGPAPNCLNGTARGFCSSPKSPNQSEKHLPAASFSPYTMSSSPPPSQASQDPPPLHVFTLPSPIDISLNPFWDTLQQNNHFLLQRTKASNNILLKSVLGTIQNVYADYLSSSPPLFEDLASNRSQL
ncbi:hypothetical protein BC938DRAFT_478360 [Jimgerdemannia flammicorona]|uniref:Uncharacterized protein n=1 Tax=Jimgerdemannia flammicorona TaxID=994334 RepID=A0A433P5P3_9FUNG|nr:hypothetical protein BC938DRAFT_478360 [Jimgerdemannia flammicorona]